MSSKRVLLLGSYGQTNLGDDLLLWNYLTWLTAHGVETIYVNTSSISSIPQVIRNKYPNAQFVETYGATPWQWLRIMSKVDAVAYGGGTVYKELYATTGRSKYSVIARLLVCNLLARMLGRQIYHLHIGIGVLPSKLGRLLTRACLRLATFTIFRDKESYAFATTTLQIPASKCCMSVDGLFLDSSWRRSWHKCMLPPSKAPITVGINALHDVPDEIDKTKYESALRTYAQNLLESGARVVLLPFQTAQNPNNDAVYMQRVFGDLIRQYDSCELLEELSIDKAISCMRQLDVYIGMRFHGLLLATAARTPYLAITYDTKCTRFIESIHYPYAIPLGAVTADTLDQAYKEVTLNRHQALGILHVAADDLFSQGKTCIEHIAL